MSNLLAFNKLNELPQHLRQEVMDFIEFLLQKTKGSKEPRKPKFGSGRGMFVIKPGFDDPLKDFEEYSH